jgi:hypothetical protein
MLQREVLLELRREPELEGTLGTLQDVHALILARRGLLIAGNISDPPGRQSAKAADGRKG